jgi:hypothetical protein
MPIIPHDDSIEEIPQGSGIVNVRVEDDDPSFVQAALDSATNEIVTEFSTFGSNLASGALESAAHLSNTTANAFMLLDRAADVLHNATGLSKGDAFERVERHYRMEGHALVQEAERFGGEGIVDKAVQIVGSLPISLAEAGAAAGLAGPVAGFAGLGALSAADQGPREAALAAVEGATIGKIFKGTEGVTKLKRGTGVGTAATGLGLARGVDPQEAVLGGITMGVLAGAGGRPKPRRVVPRAVEEIRART